MPVIPAKTTWSLNQKAVFKAVTRTTANVVINAGAGSGKTTTITEAARRLPLELDIASIAFNNHIVNELKKKMPEHIKVSTMHSFGWQCVRLHYGRRVSVDKDKVYKILERLMPTWSIDLKQRKGYAYRLNKILDLIRMTLLDVTSPTARREVIELASWHDLLFNETEAEHALLALKVINKDVETFDFTDMIYQAIQNPKVRIPKFDVVFVDEAQDLNKAQQALLFKMLKKKGRFIAVGDGRQAIYGFAGSDVESFSYLTTQENTVRLPLNVCYRCGSKIVEWAQRIVPELLPNPGGHRGVVRRGSVREIVQGDWVLCRNTKPLVSLCLALIREHRKATIKGRDYGNELIHLLQKCNTKSMRAAEIKLDLELYRLEKRLIKWGILHPTQAPSYLSLVEKVEILKELVFAEAYTIEAGIKLIQQIFSDDISAITLSTIHKSKGFENDRIFVLHPDLLPSKYATQEWQLDQERNLEYVMITRAKNELIYIMDVDK